MLGNLNIAVTESIVNRTQKKFELMLNLSKKYFRKTF